MDSEEANCSTKPIGASTWTSNVGRIRRERENGNGNTDNGQAHKGQGSKSGSHKRQPGKVSRGNILNANSNNNKGQLMHKHAESFIEANNRGAPLDHQNHPKQQHCRQQPLGNSFACLPVREDNWEAHGMRLRIGDDEQEEEEDDKDDDKLKSSGFKGEQQHLSLVASLMRGRAPSSLVVVACKLIAATNRVYNKELQAPATTTTKLKDINSGSSVKQVADSDYMFDDTRQEHERISHLTLLPTTTTTTTTTTRAIVSNRKFIISNREKSVVKTSSGSSSSSSAYESSSCNSRCCAIIYNEINNELDDGITKQPMRKAQHQLQPRHQVSFKRRKELGGEQYGAVAAAAAAASGNFSNKTIISSIIKLFLICHSVQSFLSLFNKIEQTTRGLRGDIYHNDDDGHLFPTIRAPDVKSWGGYGPMLLLVMAQEPPPPNDLNWATKQPSKKPFVELLKDVDWLSGTNGTLKQQLDDLHHELINENTLESGRRSSLNGEHEQQSSTTPLDHLFMRHKHHHHHHHHRKQKHNYHHHHKTHHGSGSRGKATTIVDDDNEDTNSLPPLNSNQRQRQQQQQQQQQQHSQRVRRNHDGGFYDMAAADRPVVASRKGLVRGVTQKLYTGKFVDAFLGLPYAKPPIGNYRFRHPQPTDPWQGELDASKLPNSCYQVNDTFFGANFQGTRIWNANTPLSEDCLYLNIWTPFGVANTTVSTSTTNGLATANKQTIHYRPPQPPASSSSSSGGDQRGNKISPGASKRPVLVWIFGGGFYYGTSTLTLYEGGLLASEEDIIVVSMNYRVSALGFLYLGRPDAPGNAGLFDQLLALQWIQDNIEQFGGDPDRVTIFGESAGAVSAAFHLLSPLSRNLFSQAILQSGAATCPWGCKEPREIMTNGLKLANLLNCPSNASDLDSVVNCLVHIDPMSMVLIAQDVDPNRSLLNFPFVPVVDGSFLLETPQESLIKSNFKRARILLGSNYDEGSAFLVYLTEFNHCPSGAGGGGGGGTGNTDELLTDQPNKQLVAAAVAPPTISNEPPTGGGGISVELRDQGGSMDSRELVASQQSEAASAAALMVSPAALANAEGASGGGGGAGRPTQHNLPPIYSDSNPCKPNESPSLTRESFLRTLKDYLNPYAEHPIGKEAIVFEYSNWNNPQDSISNYDALDKIVGDYHFTCHVNEFAYRYASTGNAVYMYYFKQRSSVSQWPKWMGVLHGDEIAFVFGEPLNPVLNYTTKEVDLSRRMMRYWANFARFGNPTKSSENVTMPEKWPEYGNNRQFFELHSDFIRLGRGPRAKQCAFWAHYLPKLIDSFDHSQCSASNEAANSAASAATLNGQYRCPPTRYHPQDPRLINNQRNGLLNNLPSLVIVSLSVILVLSIIGLLVYAKRTGKLELNLSGSGPD